MPSTENDCMGLYVLYTRRKTGNKAHIVITAGIKLANRISLLAVLTEYDRVSTAAGTGMPICQCSVLSFQTPNDNSVF